MLRRLVFTTGLTLIAACSGGTPDDSPNATGGTSSTGATGGSAASTGGSGASTGGTGSGATGTGGTTAAGATGGTSASVGGAGGTVPVGGTAGAPGTGGALGTSGSGGSDPTGGTAGVGGTGGSGGSGTPPPTIQIDPSRNGREDIQFNVTDADPTASGFHGGNQLATFDGSKTVQGYLVITMGGIGNGPHTGGAYQWAAGRGFHCIAVDMFNAEGGEGNGGLVYLESFSGQDLTGAANVTPQNGVMNRIKTALPYLNTQDPGADWDYYLDSNGEVLWDRVILWGYSYGGQVVVAATKFVAAHRIVATSAPNIPTDEAESSWLTDMDNVTDPNNSFAINDGEDEFWAVLTTLGWPGPAVRIFDGGGLLVQPPFDGSHMLDMSGGHTEFCSLPNAAYDAACDFAFGTVP